MQFHEILLFVAGGAGALATIWKTTSYIVARVKKCICFFTDMNKSIHRQENEQKDIKSKLSALAAENEILSKKTEKIKEHTAENYLRSLQLVIMSEEMPLEERLRAGEIYVTNGGNGAVKAKYKHLQSEYEREARENEKKKKA